MSYRPITDVWILARPKVKYYGAYPNGFLERARVLLGVTISDPLLHVCGGHARKYPGARGFGPNDRTLDVCGSVEPDYRADAEEQLPRVVGHTHLEIEPYAASTVAVAGWPAVLADPPYTPIDAQQYESKSYPQPNVVLRRMLAAVRLGGRVGMLHYVLPQPPREGVRFVACVGVIVGYNNRMRVFSVFEREQ